MNRKSRVFEAEHPMRYQNRFLNPKRHDEYPHPFHIGVHPLLLGETFLTKDY